jgi:hypothetical protein
MATVDAPTVAAPAFVALVSYNAMQVGIYGLFASGLGTRAA